MNPPDLVKALERLYGSVPPARREELRAEFQVLLAAIESHTRSRAKMKDAWKSRRPSFRLSWRSTGEIKDALSYEEAAKILGKSVATVRIYLSRGGGKAYFQVRDDIVTVEKQAPEKASGNRVVLDWRGQGASKEVTLDEAASLLKVPRRKLIMMMRRGPAHFELDGSIITITAHI